MANSDFSLTGLQTEAQALRQEISDLKGQKAQLLQRQLQEMEVIAERLTAGNLKELEERKQKLQLAVDQLERRHERLQAEMKQSFAGVSQDMAVRVQGFRDYLTTSLQDLVTSVEQLELTPESPPISREIPSRESSRSRREERLEARSRREEVQDDRPVREPRRGRGAQSEEGGTPQFASQSFQEEMRQIRKLIDQYRTNPNYYGPPWQLRRTFEPIHAERVSQWFFTFGGRGALKALSSRLQNILVASATISILRKLHGDRVRTLILADSPERLGDWRRGLQDCLGISRTDFGPDRGIVLFESPDSLAQKADRLVKANQLPLILLDDAEEYVSLTILQFPLWLAFAPEPQLRRERNSTFEWFE
ncbi:hypothetical protein C1752_00739 [Acaryochloris thomasi RCC1774]|uniref:DUF3086 domain-containing protein n=1 Tax=Acaryochloris thomasi RCC1774 TaxID=1764569 RepID=A0A2W1JMU9_9CYAN|nr:hypothetical protein C1752_00739 [Acaryochloris thomasi RCC1774]